jgi:hypothetical protein
MPLAPGTRLGPSEIVAPLGAGGMGEVFEARDTRLDRTVAIKILSKHLSNDAEGRERFEREAKAISKLNHQHICTLYDVGSEDGTRFLVMEYLQGETLAQRLRKGALPLDEALGYAVQMADGLDAAHRLLAARRGGFGLASSSGRIWSRSTRPSSRSSSDGSQSNKQVTRLATFSWCIACLKIQWFPISLAARRVIMRLTMCLLILGFTAPFAAGQSLGELARKEKKRRKSSEEPAAAVKVYTNDDLAGAEEEDEPEEIDETPETETETETATADVDASLDAWLAAKEAEKAAWRDRLADYQERFTAQKQRLAELRHVEQQCERDAMPAPIVDAYGSTTPDMTWGVGSTTCEALPGMIAETERTMLVIETECATEARRRFIPPGEAKLH